MADNDCNYRIPFRNQEGYPDPTAHAALNNIMRDYAVRQEAADNRCSCLIRILKNIIDFAGFDLIARIEVRDRETGRVYK